MQQSKVRKSEWLRDASWMALACSIWPGCAPAPDVGGSADAGLDVESVSSALIADSDGDGIDDSVDNCPRVSNANQANSNAFAAGDACELSLVVGSNARAVLDGRVQTATLDPFRLQPSPALMSVVASVPVGATLLGTSSSIGVKSSVTPDPAISKGEGFAIDLGTEISAYRAVSVQVRLTPMTADAKVLAVFSDARGFINLREFEVRSLGFYTPTPTRSFTRVDFRITSGAVLLSASTVGSSAPESVVLTLADACAPGLINRGQGCVDLDECTTLNTCTAAYPCVNRPNGNFYYCRGQYPEVPVSSAGTLTQNASGTVLTDSRTGLSWQRVMPDCAGDTTFFCSQAQAAALCDALSLDGFDDWRLPTAAELLSIVDTTRSPPTIDPRFTIMHSPMLGTWYHFWTSSPMAGSSRYATVDFGLGQLNIVGNVSKSKPRCVRGAGVGL